LRTSHVSAHNAIVGSSPAVRKFAIVESARVFWSSTEEAPDPYRPPPRGLQEAIETPRLGIDFPELVAKQFIARI
jgi:hypothetical protein